MITRIVEASTGDVNLPLGSHNGRRNDNSVASLTLCQKCAYVSFLPNVELESI